MPSVAWSEVGEKRLNGLFLWAKGVIIFMPSLCYRTAMKRVDAPKGTGGDSNKLTATDDYPHIVIYFILINQYFLVLHDTNGHDLLEVAIAFEDFPDAILLQGGHAITDGLFPQLFHQSLLHDHAFYGVCAFQ